MKIKRKLGGLLLILLMFAPMVLGATINTETPTGLTPPDSQYSVYWDETGSRWDNYIGTPIIRTGYNEDTWGGVLFPNISLLRTELINSANLSLYFTFELESSPIDLSITVRGIRYDFPNDETLSVADPNAPLTTAYTNVNLKNITSDQYVSIDVTDQVQEIINMYQWSFNDSLGFMILGSAQDTARTYQSNVGINVPQLDIEYGVYPSSEQGEVVDVYRNYTIIRNYLTPISAIFLDKGTTVDLLVLNEGSGARSNNWTLYDTGAYEQGNQWELDEMGGILVGNTIYMVGYDTDGSMSVHLYNCSLDNLTRWDKIASLGSTSVTTDSFTMGYDSENQTIHVAFVQTAGLYHAMVYLNGTIKKTKTLVKSGYSAGNPSESDIMIDDEGTIWISGSIPGPSSSIPRVWSGYSVDGGNTFIEIGYATTAGVYSYTPRFVDFYNTTILLYSLSTSSQVYRVYNQTDQSIIRNQTTLWSRYSRAYTTNWIEKNDLPEGYNYRDTVVITGTKSGGDIDNVRIGAGLLALNETSKAPFKYLDHPGYSNLANQTYYKRYNSKVLVGNKWYGVYYTLVDSVLWWANPAYSQDESYTFYNTNPTPLSNLFELYDTGISGMHYLEIDQNSTIETFTVIPPEGGKEPNPNCLEQATTIDEVRACIDAVDPSPDDPNPGDWAETGSFTRAKIRYYFFVIGWILFWLPLYYFAWVVKGVEKIIYIWVILVTMILSLGILWSIPYI